MNLVLVNWRKTGYLVCVCIPIYIYIYILSQTDGQIDGKKKGKRETECPCANDRER